MRRQLPLIVVLGATATGKSRLAIELARRFGGELISADSMQIYQGLNIVTNKVTEEEQNQARHHMINFLEPTQRFSILDFRNRSLNVIDSLLKKQILPIVVGGTQYYIESLLWQSYLVGATDSPQKRSHQDLTDEPESQETLINQEALLLESLPIELRHSNEDLDDPEKFFQKPIFNDSLIGMDSTKLWQLLEKVDATAAHTTPPANKRRVIRRLQIIQQHKRSYTDLLEELNKSEGGRASLGGKLRYKSTVVIWLDCEKQLLDEMLTQRVDKMIERGLLKELEDFHEKYNEQRISEGRSPDYTKGIFQTIGFKEFHDYLVLDKESKSSDEGKTKLAQSIEALKLSTKQYARKQVKQIRRRLLFEGLRDVPPVFRLQTAFTEDEWTQRVQTPAFQIVRSYLESLPLSEDLEGLIQKPQKYEPDRPGLHHCQPCNRTFVGTRAIDSHIKSRTHWRKKRDRKLSPEIKSAALTTTEEQKSQALGKSS